MKCYYHPDREAVAVCSMCGKPLCEECAHEYKGKIYCKDCLAKVKAEEAKNAAVNEGAAKNPAPKETAATKAENSTEEKIPYRSTAKIIFWSIIIALVIIGLILLSTAGIFFGTLTPLAFTPTVNNPKSHSESISALSYGNEQTINISTSTNNCALNIKEIENATDKKIIAQNAESAKLAELTRYNAIAKMSYKGGTLTINANGLGKNAVVNLYITNRLKSISIDSDGKNAVLTIMLPDIPIDNLKLSITNGALNLSDSSADRISGSEMNNSIKISNSSVTEISLKGMNSRIAFDNNEFLGNVSLNLINGVLEIKGSKRIVSFYEKGVNSVISCDFSETAPPMDATFKNITTEVKINVGKQPAIISAPYTNVKANSYFTVNGSNYITPNYSEQSPHLAISVLPAGETAIPLGSVKLSGGE